MDQNEQKSKKQFMKELAALSQQLSDLEEQGTNFDQDGDIPEGQESATVVSKRIKPEFQDVLVAASEAVLVVDSHGRIILANESAENLFGYSQDYLIDHSVEL